MICDTNNTSHTPFKVYLESVLKVQNIEQFLRIIVACYKSVVFTKISISPRLGGDYCLYLHSSGVGGKKLRGCRQQYRNEEADTAAGNILAE